MDRPRSPTASTRTQFSAAGLSGIRSDAPRWSLSEGVNVVRIAWVAAAMFLAGCGSERTICPAPATPPDAEAVRTADYSILFVGNSHTSGHNLPELVCAMIRFRHPDNTALWWISPVGF